MSQPYHNPELIIKLYTIDNLSSIDIANQLGITDTTVRNWLKRFNIPIKKLGSFTYKNIKVTPQLEETICKLYKSGLSSREVSKEVNICKQTIIETVNKNGIISHKPNFNAPQWSESHLWQGWISWVNILIRTRKQTKQWKKKVLERDNNTCVWCWSKEKLQVDHIIPLKEIRKKYSILEINDELFIKIPLLTDINNGRTLCTDCHLKTETYWNR